MLTEEWIPHRRSSDGELVGWIRPEGEHWVAVSLLGHEETGAVEWLDAEEHLEQLSLAWLAEPWQLERDDGRWIRVRIVEVSPDRPTGEPGRIVVKTEDWGAIDVPYELIELPWPLPVALRPLRPGDGSESPFG